MIEPGDSDIDRRVIYRTRRLGRDNTEEVDQEEGTITSFNGHYVFVRYGADLHSKGTRHSDI